ncbi:Immunoglobulin E-set [Cordyceps militaris]|uniref:Immunoglobulin E-set n=1 Tax=Cordyceps militaris TaxID=73501 RepID=A0A2H4SQY2_CORMI|nr:Immunoglobulin E-set [Cordyceps militaris]
MSMRITLDNQPEFFTNLDIISGQVLLHLNRPEQIGGIIVKLEGESNTSLQPPSPFENGGGRGNRDGYSTSNAAINAESHKILYKVQQVFPDEYHTSTNNPFGSFPLQPGQHQFPFKFKVPINNACSDSHAMASLANQSLSGAGMFGARGIRLMDGTRQLYLRHVTKTLPPSLSGVYNDAEIRYYIKVTVQRPGLLKENWRFQLGFKFMPIEPPRPAGVGQESFARRPFSFTSRPPSPPGKLKNSMFGMKKSSKEKNDLDSPTDSPPPPQSVELSARLPHPLILTCNRPVPLRLIAKKLVNNPQQVYLTSFQMDLIGVTTLSAHGQTLQKSNRWIIASNPQLEVPLVTPTGEVGSEITVPDQYWSQKPLPNTVAPSFTACNISRRYEVQILLTLRLGKRNSRVVAESITLPLHFAAVDVYSGIKPPRELVEAATNAGFSQSELRPHLPPRQSVSGANGSAAPHAPPLPLRRPSGPTQPPPAAQAEEYEDAPPSYSEAMADSASMPFDQNNPRPPFSGVTTENAPSQLPPQKN